MLLHPQRPQIHGTHELHLMAPSLVLEQSIPRPLLLMQLIILWVSSVSPLSRLFAELLSPGAFHVVDIEAIPYPW